MRAVMRELKAMPGGGKQTNEIRTAAADLQAESADWVAAECANHTRRHGGINGTLPQIEALQPLEAMDIRWEQQGSQPPRSAAIDQCGAMNPITERSWRQIQIQGRREPRAKSDGAGG